MYVLKNLCTCQRCQSNPAFGIPETCDCNIIIIVRLTFYECVCMYVCMYVCKYVLLVYV